MIPNKLDCDAHRGEPALTANQIQEFKESFKKYNIMDKNHDVLYSAKSIAEPVDSFILSEPTTYIWPDNTEHTYPAGTWMLTSRITDKATENEILQGELNGYSASVYEESAADKIKAAMKSSAGKLIKDIPNPKVATVSIVSKPCQTGSRFCKLKNDNNTSNSDNMTENDSKTLDKIRETLGISKENYATKEDLEDLKESYDSALKSNFESLESSITKAIVSALSEVGATKSNKEDDENNNGEGNESQESNEGETNNNNSNGSSEDEGNDDGEEDDDKKKNNNGNSKTPPNHDNNGATKSDEPSTYAFLGRNPDGTRKREDIYKY